MNKTLSRSIISSVVFSILFGGSFGVLAQSNKTASSTLSVGTSANSGLIASASANGEMAVAAGYGTRASEKFSTAVGSWAAADGKQSVALGGGAYAYANASTALGSVAFVHPSTTYGTAVGNRANVAQGAIEGTALGAKATVVNKNSVALGANSRTTRDNEVYIGYEDEAGKVYKSRVLGGLSDGTRPSDAATVRQVDRVKDSVEQLAQDANVRFVVEAKKSRDYTDARTTVGMSAGGSLSSADGANKTIAVNEGLLMLSGRTDKLDTAVAATDAKVESQTITVNKALVTLTGKTERLDTAVGATAAKIESRTTVGVSSDGTLTHAEGAKNTIAVNDGLVALSDRTDKIDAAVGAVDRRVTSNTHAVQKNRQAIAANTRTLQQHSARLDNQQRQIKENHEEMKRAAAQSAALTGLFQPYSVGKFNASAAVGGYSDEQALAVGVGYRFNEQTAAKAGVAFSDGDASWNVGVNFEF